MIDQVLSIEQMMELDELGFPNFGSMYWHNYNTDEEPEYELCSTPDVGDLRTCTLQDLLDFLAVYQLSAGMNNETGHCTYTIHILHNGGLTVRAESALEAVFEAVKWFLQENTCPLKKCECYYLNSEFCTSISKEKPVPECMHNSAMNQAQTNFILKQYGNNSLHNS